MDVKDVYEFMAHFWKFIKVTWNRPYTDEYWHELLDGAGKIADAYERHDLVKRLLTAYVEYHDAEYKKQMEQAHEASEE